jgi:large subunit ribosomal protein L20
MMNKGKIFKLAKGFRGRAKNCIRIARERVEKSLQYAFRDRRTKKRDMRSLWITRITAGSRQYGVSRRRRPPPPGRMRRRARCCSAA